MRLRIKIGPLPVRSPPPSSQKISNRLIPRTFHLPIISRLRRTIYLDEDSREEAGAVGLSVRVLAKKDEYRKAAEK